jgi:hypothetical protein
MRYQIRVQGHLDDAWSSWFEGLTITNLDGGEAVLEGCLVDQPALYGVLVKVCNLGLPLLALQRVDADGGADTTVRSGQR